VIPRDVKAPTLPIPFHERLKIVAIVDEKDPLTMRRYDFPAGSMGSKVDATCRFAEATTSGWRSAR
jgi:hypothetical protein